MKKRIFLILTLLCICCSMVWGEAPKRKSDINFWETFGIDVRVHNIFKVYFEKQLRYREKFSNLGADIMEAGVRVKLYKGLAIRTNYRYIIRQNTKRYRFDANLQCNFKVKLIKNKKEPLRVSLRSRIQKEHVKDNVFNNSFYEFRNRVKFSYRLKKIWEPFLGFEVFRGLGDKSQHLHKFRLTLGTEWRPKKRFTIKLSYHFQEDMVTNLSEKSHIFATKFNYSF